VSRIEDIQRLLELEREGIIGVIVGRALYTGSLDLGEAIRLTRFPLGSTKSQAPNSK